MRALSEELFSCGIYLTMWIKLQQNLITLLPAKCRVRREFPTVVADWSSLSNTSGAKIDVRALVEL
jgi:hypothetical protein